MTRRFIEIVRAARIGKVPIPADLHWIKEQLEIILRPEVAAELGTTVNQLRDEVNRYAMHAQAVGLI